MVIGMVSCEDDKEESIVLIESHFLEKGVEDT